MSPLPLVSVVEPLILTVTSGIVTPISSRSVTPMRPVMRIALAVSVTLAVATRESAADGAVIERTCNPLNAWPPNRLKLELMKLTPMLTPPSPNVSARSATVGPKVVAVRT